MRRHGRSVGTDCRWWKLRLGARLDHIGLAAGLGSQCRAAKLINISEVLSVAGYDNALDVRTTAVSGQQFRPAAVLQVQLEAQYGASSRGTHNEPTRGRDARSRQIKTSQAVLCCAVLCCAASMSSAGQLSFSQRMVRAGVPAGPLPLVAASSGSKTGQAHGCRAARAGALPRNFDVATNSESTESQGLVRTVIASLLRGHVARAPGLASGHICVKPHIARQRGCFTMQRSPTMKGGLWALIAVAAFMAATAAQARPGAMYAAKDGQVRHGLAC